MPKPMCPKCGAARPLELSMRGKDGHTLTMVSCPRCETRSWYADGEPVERDSVLKLSAGDPGFVMTPSPGRGSPKR